MKPLLILTLCHGLLLAAEPGLVATDTPTPAQEGGNLTGNGELDLSKFPGMVIEDVVVPVPSEILSILDKLGDPEWKKELNLEPRPAFTDRQEVALLLGITVADGFVAVQAQDLQSVEFIGKEVLNLARALGVRDAVVPHCNAISAAAKKGDWKQVRDALDATQAAVKARMEKLRDELLAECISVGGWLRGTQVITSVIGTSFTREKAELLHQPDLAQYFRDTLVELQARSKEKSLTQAKLGMISSGLAQIHDIMRLPEAQLDKESVDTINRITTDLVTRIQTKE